MFNTKTGENDLNPDELLKFIKIIQLLSTELYAKLGSTSSVIDSFSEIVVRASDYIEEDRLFKKALLVYKTGDNQEFGKVMNKINIMKERRKQNWQTM